MTLHLLSPLDGRYAEATKPLTGFFSEFAFLRDRVRVELNFLLALSKTGLTRPLSDSESAQVESIISNFSTADAELILEHERKTRHDVKAIEYFIQSKFLESASSLANMQERAPALQKLRPYFATPFGDMMIAGCFGLLVATAEIMPNLAEPIQRSLRGENRRGVAPWDA